MGLNNKEFCNPVFNWGRPQHRGGPEWNQAPVFFPSLSSARFSAGFVPSGSRVAGGVPQPHGDLAATQGRG